MKLVSDALGVSASYDASLSSATKQLSTAQNRDQVKTIVASLVKSTREMRETNKALEERLTLSKSEISNLQQSLEAIRAESLTDPLTGLGNRKYFDRSIEMAVQTALANGEPLSLLMFDIDHFKSFNDSYGHLTGDQRYRLADRTRRCLPLCRQAQRPQPRDLRSRPGIRRREPQSGRLGLSSDLSPLQPHGALLRASRTMGLRSVCAAILRDARHARSSG
jgi:hypothetical protein